MNIMAFEQGEDGCSEYRARQPLEALRQRGNDVFFIKGNAEVGELLDRLPGCDMLFINNRTGRDVAKLVHIIKKRLNPAIIKDGYAPVKIAVDYDDNVIDVNPLSDSYRYGGTEEAGVKDAEEITYIWKDGQSGFNIKRNKRNQAYILSIIKNADLLTTTTPVIGGFYKQYNNNIAILPNAIDFTKWDVRRKRPRLDNKIRIGWHGGASHYVDFKFIIEPLRRILQEFPDVSMQFFGHAWAQAKFNPRQIITQEWTPINAFPLKMIDTAPDIAIIPIEDNRFNACKSSIKYCEYAALKVPCLVQNNLPYTLDCADGENALTFNSQEECYRKLKRLILDGILRKKLAEQAYWYVRKNYELDGVAAMYDDAFMKLTATDNMEIITL